MTEYEKSVENGLPRMNSMEWLLLQISVEDIIKNPEGCTKDDAEAMMNLKMEIDHFYRDNQELLTQFYKIVEEKLS